MNAKNEDLPKLQAPGAGLPFAQRLAIQFWFGPIVSKRTPLSECRKSFEILTAKTIDRYQSINPISRETKVLVSPIMGLEDSSRYWSANDVLEHVLIVTKMMETVILTLASGRKLNAVADVAKVKPKGDRAPDPLKQFSDYMTPLMQTFEEKLSAPGMNILSPLTFRHPWFGEITARQWYWLTGQHLGIHYTQIKKIATHLK